MPRQGLPVCSKIKKDVFCPVGATLNHSHAQRSIAPTGTKRCFLANYLQYTKNNLLLQKLQKKYKMLSFRASAATRTTLLSAATRNLRELIHSRQIYRTPTNLIQKFSPYGRNDIKYKPPFMSFRASAATRKLLNPASTPDISHAD